MKKFDDYLKKYSITVITTANVSQLFYEVYYDEIKELEITKEQFVVLVNYFGLNNFDWNKRMLIGIRLYFSK